MPYFIKLEKHKVAEMRDGAVYKTVKVCEEWFDSREQPEMYVIDDTGHMYVVTNDYHFGTDKPC